MEWWVFRKIDSNQILVEEFGKIINYKYPEHFIQIVKQFDGGTPEYMVYDTKSTKRRVFNNLLSFEKNRKSTMWNNLIHTESTDENGWTIEGLDWRYIPFARDPFGNFICFDRTNDHIVFWNHETDEVEEVADSFSEFIDSLYESEE